MARAIRPLRKCLQFSPSSSSASPIPQMRRQNLIAIPPENHCVYHNTLRHYITDMRRSAFEGNLLRFLRNEIRYELEHSPPNQPVAKFGGFTIDERPGEQWIRLEKKYANENIKIEVTMIDQPDPDPKSKDSTGDDQFYFYTVFVSITKGESNDVLKIMCSAWSNGLEIKRLSLRQGDKMTAPPYPGPAFKELDDDLQGSLYAYLEAREVDDDLASFLHKYMKNKRKTELIRWMKTVKAFVEK